MKVYAVTHPYFEDICEFFLQEEDAILFQEGLEYCGIDDSIKLEFDLENIFDMVLSNLDSDDLDSDEDLIFLDKEDILKLFTWMGRIKMKNVSAFVDCGSDTIVVRMPYSYVVHILSLLDNDYADLRAEVLRASHRSTKLTKLIKMTL